jgi:hypothetical protein
MKKYTLLFTLLLFQFCPLFINAQTLNELMKEYTNIFALEHSELMIDPKYSQAYQESLPYPIYERIRIANVDNIWLQKITVIVKPNPSVLFPYLETENYNLSAYILLSHIFDLKFTAESEEDVTLHILKKEIYTSEGLGIDEFTAYINAPVGVDKLVYTLNTVWKDKAPEANARIKALLP